MTVAWTKAMSVETVNTWSNYGTSLTVDPTGSPDGLSVRHETGGRDNAKVSGQEKLQGGAAINKHKNNCCRGQEIRSSVWDPLI